MKSGFVSIVGRPNVGKSTLLNKILKQKVSIVCDKSQTTRNNIKGIYNDPDSQIIFIDTPGIHKPKVKLGEEMNNMAISSTKDVDLIIYMVDSGFSFSKDDEDIINKVNNKEIPTIIVFNKIDLARITRVNELKEKYNSLLPNATQVEIVAKDGFNVDSLLTLIKDKLPEGPRYYDENEVTDNDEVFLIKEIIREKALYVLSDEVPHCVAVYMNNIEWEENPISIDATIIVEKDSQKGIVIGANGKRIKEISTKARQSIEALLKKHVFIRIQVKVKEDWRNNDSALQEFGYKTKKEK